MYDTTSVTRPLSGNSWSENEPSSPVVAVTPGNSFTRMTVPMSGSPVLWSVTTPSSVWALRAAVMAINAVPIKSLFIVVLF